MARSRQHWLLVSLLLLAVAPGSARADGGALKLRFALIFEEAIDGKAATANRVEAELTEKLVDAGMVLVDRDRALALKKELTVKKLLEAEDLTRLTAFDADVVIVGRTESNALGKSVMGTSWMSYEVQAMLRVVRTDTAQIMFAPTEATTGVDLNPTGAVRDGARKMSNKLTKLILSRLTAMADQFGGLTVTIAGLPEYQDFSSLLSSLKKVEGVTSVRPRRYSKDASLVEITGKGLSGDATAAAIAAVRPDLEVQRASSRAVILRFKPGRGVSLPVTVTRFSGPARPAAVASLRITAPALIETALADASFIEVSQPEGGRPEARGKKAVAALARKTGAAVVVTGEVVGRGKNRVLTLKALDAGGGKALLTRKEKLGQDPLAAVDKIGKGLADELLERALANQRLVKRQQLGALKQRVAAGPGAGPNVRVASVNLSRVFPSRMRLYASQPLGKAVLCNRGKGEALDLVISVEVPGLTRLPTEQTLASLGPGKTAEVDLKVTFDPDALFKVEETRPSQLAVTVVYAGGEVEQETRSVKPLTVVSRNALDWREPNSAAAFVTPKDTAVMEFAKAAVAQSPQSGELPRPVRVAASLWSALAAVPLRYNPDPSSPFGSVILDDVQFARDTLRYKSGDCDDLSVLFSSLLEALGVRASLITTPGHVLVGLDTGLPSSSAIDLSTEPGRVVSRGGRAWMPLEVTRLPKSFEAAWQAGAAELKRRGKAAEWIPIGSAWQSHPPIPLPAGKAVRFPDAAEVKQAAAGAVTAVSEHATAALDKRIRKLTRKARKSADARNELAQLLVRKGDLAGAEAMLRKNLKTDRDPARAHNNLANVLVLSDRAAEASREYTAAVKFAKSRGSIYANLAVAMYLEGDAEGATETFAKSIQSGGQGALGAAGLVVDETAGRTAAEKKNDVSVPDLQYLIDCALKKLPANTKKIKYKTGQPLGARRGVEAERRELLRLLFWL